MYIVYILDLIYNFNFIPRNSSLTDCPVQKWHQLHSTQRTPGYQQCADTPTSALSLLITD